LCQGLENADLNLDDIAIAQIISMHILSQWRKDLLKGVSEGEVYEEYSNILVPSPKTDSEKLAMQLVYFKKIDTSTICPAKQGMSKEEQAAEITRQIVYSTKKSEPIFVTAYLSSSDSDSDSEITASGTAVKVSANKWKVVIENHDTVITATDNDLINTNKFLVERKCMSLHSNETLKRNNQQNKSVLARLKKWKKRKKFVKKAFK